VAILRRTTLVVLSVALWKYPLCKRELFCLALLGAWLPSVCGVS
jgi:hypothetical protein